MKRLICFAAGILVAGCAGGDGTPALTTINGVQLIEGFNPPQPPAGKFVVVTPVIKDIEPGQDVTFCTYLEQTVDAEIDVTNFESYQSASGHHIMLATARRPMETGTHVCTEDDMVNTGTFMAGGGAEGNSNYKGVPAGLAFRVPAGSHLLLQTHWINASLTPKDGQAVIYITANPSSPSVTQVDQFLADTTAFTIPAGQSATATTICKFQQDLSFFEIAGHMHEWGKKVQLDLIDVDNTEKTIYSMDWKHEYMTNPPANWFTKDAPFVIKKGQSVRVTCNWDNTKGTKDIKFPQEMCYMVGYYFPGNGMIDCADGAWPSP